ncbi:hypothetical protein EBR96_03780 [bacterium]|nr:hypothetical protein [bacterium]
MIPKSDNLEIFNRFRPVHWVILTVTLVLAGIGIWQSILPYLAERHYRDGFNFDAMQRFKYAVEELELAVRYAPWETQYMMALAKAYEGIGEKDADPQAKIAAYNKAEAIYKRTIELDEKNPWQHNRLSVVYLALSDIIPAKKASYMELAEREVRLAAQYDGQNPLFQLNLAYFLHRTNRLDEAEKYYNIVIEMDPNIAEARYNLADIYRRRNLLNKSLEAYLQVYGINKDFPNINLAISSTYIQLGRESDAIPFLEEEVKKRPDYVEGIRLLITLQSRRQNWSRVAELYYQMIMLNPGSKEYYLPFAEAVKRSGKQAETVAQLSEMARQAPGNSIIPELIQLVR